MRIFKKKKQIKKEQSKSTASITQRNKDLNSTQKKMEQRKEFENPYLDQLHRFYEASLLNDDDMDEAHNVSQFLLKNPEFYPIEEEEPAKDDEDDEKKE